MSRCGQASKHWEMDAKNGVIAHLNPNSPKTGTIATWCHSPRSVAASSISPRRLWQSTFHRLWNRENPKNRENTMLKAGEGCPTPLFQGAEGRGHEESTKLRFGGPTGIEARFRLLFEVFVGGEVRV